MKDLHSHPRYVRRLSLSLLLAGVGLLLCGPAAQAANPEPKRSSAAPAAKAQSPAGKAVAPGATATATRPALATVSSGKYKITVESVRWARGQHTVSLEQSGLPVSANFTADGKGSGSGRGLSGGSGSGRAGGSSGYSSSGGSGKSSWSGGAGARGGAGGGFVSGGGSGGTSGAGFGSGGGSGGHGASGGSASSGGHFAGSSSASGGSSGFSSSSSAGGAGGGAAAGTFGGTFGEVNLVVDLRVSTPKTDRNQLLCAVVGQVQAKDDQGKAIDAPDLPAHLKMQLGGLDYPQGSGCTSVHLNIENTDARSIKSLAGELVVMDARIQTIAFEGRALNTVSTRQLTGVKVRLDKVESTEEGINVSAGVSMPNPFTDQLNFHNIQNRLRVVLEDSEGDIHTPQSMSGGGGGGGGGGGAFSSAGGGNGMRRSGGGTGTAQTFPLASYNLTFAPLPQGVTIRKIVCTTTELLGQPQRVAFRFSDLPLP